MDNNKWMITINMILIFLLILNPISIQATIFVQEHFSPTTTGEIWEHLFSLDSTDNFQAYFQIGAFAKYHVTINLDSVDAAPYSVSGLFTVPPNHSLNNNPAIKIRKTERFSLTDGEEISFIVTSSIHLGMAYVYLTFDDDYPIPSNGISGKLTVQVIDLGLQDNSLYRTEFRLNPNQSSFDFEFEPIILIDAKLITYGHGAELKAVVSSSANSTGEVLLNVSDSFKEIYSQKITTLQPMNIRPGTTLEQIFTQNNDEYDSFIHVPFSLSLINTSAEASGNLTIYLHELGHYSTEAGSLGMILGFFCIVVIVRKRSKKKSRGS
ncbi:MAG: hypothetical protein ACXADY_08715 [Candidatus Hodarchaeales archaeon]|jgi:hypothetical protein